MNISPLCRNTRPEGQLPPQEQAAFDLLDRLGIDYDRVSHEAAFNMELCADVAAALGVPVCKNLFLCNRQQTAFYLLCMMPDKPFHTKDLSAQIGSSRLSFAPEDKLWELLLLERTVYEAPYISCHPCVCTSTLKLKTGDVLEKLLPAIGHEAVVVDL